MKGWNILQQKMKEVIICDLFLKEFPEGGVKSVHVTENSLERNITVYSSRLGMLIGKQGIKRKDFVSKIKNFGEANPKKFGLSFEDDVVGGEFGIANPQYLANEISTRGKEAKNFKRVANFFLRKLKGEVSGVRIKLKGVLRGNRASKMIFGFGKMKVSGAMQKYIETASSPAVLDMGVVNVTVSLVRPGLDLPDKFRIKEEYLDQSEGEALIE